MRLLPSQQIQKHQHLFTKYLNTFTKSSKIGLSMEGFRSFLFSCVVIEMLVLIFSLVLF